MFKAQIERNIPFMRGGKKNQKENILLYVGQINLVRHLIVEGPGGTSDGEVIE